MDAMLSMMGESRKYSVKICRGANCFSTVLHCHLPVFLCFPALLNTPVGPHQPQEAATFCWSPIQVRVTQTASRTQKNLLHRHNLPKPRQLPVQLLRPLYLLLLWAHLHPINCHLHFLIPILTAVCLPTLSRLRQTRNSVPCRNTSPLQCSPDPPR